MKGYMVLVREATSDLQAAHQGAEDTTRKLVKWEAKVSELDLKIQLLAE